MDRTEARLILGLGPNATMEDAEIAYRSLAKIVHPDVGGDEITFGLLQEAWEVMRVDSSTDPQKTPSCPPAAQPPTGVTTREEMNDAWNRYFFRARMAIALAVLLGLAVKELVDGFSR